MPGTAGGVAQNEIVIDRPAADVFAFLSDGRRYADWVVGAKRVRDVDETWPAPGSRIHHTVGIGPLEIKDNTEVEQVVDGKRLVLRARARPAGIARVELDLHPDGGSTRVVMVEYPVSGIAKTIQNPLLDASLKARNVEALRRLKREVEQASA